MLEARMITPEDLERGLDVKASDPDRRLGAILVELTQIGRASCRERV